jgi:hypothetical protein
MNEKKNTVFKKTLNSPPNKMSWKKFYEILPERIRIKFFSSNLSGYSN